jgi:hypothetical protein
MKLTVGVCTINGREDLCTRIVTKLYEQARGKDVQILWVGDNRKMVFIFETEEGLPNERRF